MLPDLFVLSQPFFLAGEVLAVIAVVGYIVRARSGYGTFSARGLGQVFLSGFGVASGAKIFYVANAALDLGPLSGEGDRILILLAGGAVMLLSGDSIYRLWMEPE